MKADEKKMKIDDAKASAAFHAKMGKACADCADAHSALSKNAELTDPTSSKLISKVAEAEAAKAAAHSEEGDRQLACCKAAEAMPADEDGPKEKVAATGELGQLLARVDELLGKLQPTNVRVAPTQDRPVLVPRPGASPTQTEISKVDPSLRHLVLDESQAS
jgi:hypothetical protein